MAPTAAPKTKSILGLVAKNRGCGLGFFMGELFFATFHGSPGFHGNNVIYHENKFLYHPRSFIRSGCIGSGGKFASRIHRVCHGLPGGINEQRLRTSDASCPN